jgi:hypothetical protein
MVRRLIRRQRFDTYRLIEVLIVLIAQVIAKHI